MKIRGQTSHPVASWMALTSASTPSLLPQHHAPTATPTIAFVFPILPVHTPMVPPPTMHRVFVVHQYAQLAPDPTVQLPPTHAALEIPVQISTGPF